ncbi:MBL fold metallo-hydrolase [Albimonas sp. CAU 1670]|uniref:MBL fold metallo-hydrolase n=1 Tax=Albimonas sp. CAU 1670 TaxID=3032599 RepID=UPI0023DA92B1|nr:MBL fold metallo-hydrolase [Albimonas sp. CAU 1670]MDF2233317.1 MBL fold metallo-hydrolase [Albimonas sp. CAU 1670]
MSPAADPSGPGASSGGVRLTVWGAGGSAPTGRAGRARFGGDTVCFEIRRDGCGSPPLIVDLGSAARDLGRTLKAEALATGRPTEAEILLSHLHLDHIIGAPFFAPFYDPASRIRIRCGLGEDSGFARDTLMAFAGPPIFPIQPIHMSEPAWDMFRPGETFEAAGFQVTPIALNHPGGCCGFRIETGEGAICVIGDHEHGDPAIDAGVAEAVEGAAVMLYDAAYDDADYERHRGWGHSTWSVGGALAARAGVGLTLFHHHPPELDDAALDLREADARAAYPRARLARQGMSLRLADGRAELL